MRSNLICTAAWEMTWYTSGRLTGGQSRFQKDTYSSYLLLKSIYAASGSKMAYAYLNMDGEEWISGSEQREDILYEEQR